MRIMQGIAQARSEELRRVWCESLVMAQILDLHKNANSCQMHENSMILNPGAALERPTYLIKLLRF